MESQDILRTFVNDSQTIYRFENGLGLSVLKLHNNEHNYSNQYEIAVIQFIDKDKYRLIYPDFMNGDVIRCSTLDEIDKYLEIIKRIL